MPLIDRFAPGTFCWTDLGTPDAPAATRFYSALFGWTAEDRPMGPDAFYTMFELDGRPVAALYPQEEATPEGPPHWLSYVAVDSANEGAARTKTLGGVVLMEPFDVLDVGRMAMVQDPTGAVVALWEARRHAGAGVIGEASAMCWNELGTTDTRRAGEFYSSLLGWSAETRSMGTFTYTTFTADGATRGGMMTIAPSWGRVPPHWLVYFAVRDCEGTAALCQSLGGTVRVPPTDIPDVGRFAVLADPQGAVFAVIALVAAGGYRPGLDSGMDAIDAIQRRTSVRRFRPDPVPREIIARLLDCAVRAPNHKLTEPWRFTVVTGPARERFAELRAAHRRKRYDDPTSDEARAAADKVRRETAETPAFIVVQCAVSTDEQTREEDYAAAMMATANVLIAAQSLGVGTYLKTGGIMRDSGLAALVGLEDGFRIVGVVSLGYPEGQESPRRRRPAADITRWVDG